MQECTKVNPSSNNQMPLSQKCGVEKRQLERLIQSQECLTARTEKGMVAQNNC